MDELRSIDVSKLDRQALSDQPAPMLQWVPIEKLVVDPSYQREVTGAGWATIRRIASDFRWSRFAPLLCAPIEGGRFSIIDGQHRAHAAAACGIEAVPAMIVPVSRAEQARAFADVNGKVTAVSNHHIYRAAITAGEAWALECRAACEEAGCWLMTSNNSTANKRAGQVYAIALVRDLVARGHATAVTRGLQAIKAHDVLGRPALYSNYILRPWLTAIATVESGLKDWFPADILADVLNQNPPFKVLDVIDRLAASRALDAPKAVASRRAFEVLLRKSGGAA